MKRVWAILHFFTQFGFIVFTYLAQEETNLIKPDQSYPIWSPYDAFDAANTMLEVLQAAKSQNND